MTKIISSLAALLLLVAVGQSAELKVKSPDRKVVVTVTDKGGLSYSVAFDGREVVARSRFGIVADGVDLGASVTLGKAHSRKIRESYPMFGGHSRGQNYCNETTICLLGQTGERFELDVRVYNDGAALRVRLPAKPGRRINGEVTEWRLTGNPVAWYQTNTFDYEGVFQDEPLRNLSEGKRIALPITFSLDGGGYALITEANLISYSDLAVEVGPDHVLRGVFHARPDANNGWTTDNAVVQPWRVTMLVRDLNALVNSDLIGNLCPAASPDLARANWIKPGRCAWQWWSVGAPVLAEQRQWVDWTKELGFEYYLIDEGWKSWKADGKDHWACLREVCEYAKTQGVKIWCWVNSRDVSTPERRVDFLNRAVAAGVVGVKIDFVPEAGLRWVNWYEDTLRDTAAKKLMVNFHGANKPTGRQRTWPHELTREAVRGHEYHILRYNRTLPPHHDCVLPFTRFVIGPADYTPTVFNPRELRGYTWAHELAQAIVFTSPFLCYADHPTNYLSNPALDVLKAIPATWDETIVLPGSEIGKCVAFARRKGKNWFIGIINGPAPITLELVLDFPGQGKYRMIQLGDTPDRTDAWQREERIVRKGQQIRVSMRPAGGCVVYLKPFN